MCALRVRDLTVQPRPLQQPHPPIWVAGGRSLDTVEYAAREGLNLALPQLAGPFALFKPAADLYRQRLAERGGGFAGRVSVGQHSWVAPTFDAAVEDWRESYPRYMKMVADEMPADLYAGTELEEVAARTRSAARVPAERLFEGAGGFGAPETVAERLCSTWDALRMDHCWACFNLGGLPTAKLTKAMELYAREVLPRVKAHTG